MEVDEGGLGRKFGYSDQFPHLFSSALIRENPLKVLIEAPAGLRRVSCFSLHLLRLSDLRNAPSSAAGYASPEQEGQRLQRPSRPIDHNHEYSQSCISTSRL